MIARVPRSRLLLWSSRITAVFVTVAGPLVLVAELAGLISPVDQGASWELLVAFAVWAWVTFWTGYVFALGLELTDDGSLVWHKAFRRGEIPLAEVDRISDVAWPFFYTVHHTGGRLHVAFVPDMRPFIEAIERQRAA